MLEHGTLYFWNPVDSCDFESIRDKYSANKFSEVRADGQAITTNYRVIIENGWEDDLYMLTEPTEYHEKRYTFKVNTSIGITREFNRHRVNSIAEQSTRYCNYSKDKFGGEIPFMQPEWYNRMTEEQQHSFREMLQEAENNYMILLDKWDNRKPDKRFKTGFKGNPQTPQQAREVLPLSTATEAVYTAFESDWKHFFDLRLRGTTGKPHPNMVELAELMSEQLKKKGISL
jgi:thymidylate synthase (FAD)